MPPLDKKQNKTTVRSTEQMQRPGHRKEAGARTGWWWPALVPDIIGFADFAGDIPSCEKHFSFIRTFFGGGAGEGFLSTFIPCAYCT